MNIVHVGNHIEHRVPVAFCSIGVASMITTADTIVFHDPDRKVDGVAIVRYDDESVCFCLSLESDGDVEVTMKKEDAKRLAKALDMALR